MQVASSHLLEQRDLLLTSIFFKLLSPLATLATLATFATLAAFITFARYACYTLLRLLRRKELIKITLAILNNHLIHLQKPTTFDALEISNGVEH